MTLFEIIILGTLILVRSQDSSIFALWSRDFGDACYLNSVALLVGHIDSSVLLWADPRDVERSVRISSSLLCRSCLRVPELACIGRPLSLSVIIIEPTSLSRFYRETRRCSSIKQRPNRRCIDVSLSNKKNLKYETEIFSHFVKLRILNVQNHKLALRFLNCFSWPHLRDLQSWKGGMTSGRSCVQTTILFLVNYIYSRISLSYRLTNESTRSGHVDFIWTRSSKDRIFRRRLTFLGTANDHEPVTGL